MKIENIEPFSGKSYSSLLELAKDCYLYPNRFNKFYNSNKFLTILKNEDSKKYEEFLKIKKMNYRNEIFNFKVSYLLNPYMKLSYEHFIFDDYKKIGTTMLSYAPIVDVYLKDLLIYHLLSEYMENTNDNKRYESIYLKVKENEKKVSQSQNLAYWNLAFDLVGDNTLIYKGKKFTNPKDFFEYIQVVNDLLIFSSSFLEDGLVICWLERLGYSYLISKLLSLIDLSNQIDQTNKKVIAKNILSNLNNSRQESKK